MSVAIATYSDAELIRLLQGQGAECEQAFRELYSRYARRVLLYCSRILDSRTAAEDVLQESFVDFLRYIRSTNVSTESKLPEVRNVPALLMRIARNRCLNIKRQERIATVPLDELQLPALHDDSSAESMSEEMAELLRESLPLLGDEYREALVLQMYNGLSYQEIAELLGVPLTTVRNRIVRAKNKLRDILQPYRNNYR